MYTITTEEHDVTEYATRAIAVATAKEMTMEDGEVVVSDQSGREAMVYRRGILDSYEYETRPRRK